MDNVYEMHVSFEAGTEDIVGMNLCDGDGHKVTICYDADSRRLTVDRTNSTDADIPKFERIASARLPEFDGDPHKLDLTVIVDKSVIEIFANGGKSVFSLLTFSPEESTGADLFSLRGNSKASVEAWQLKSIWD